MYEKAPDTMLNINFKLHYLRYFLAKSYARSPVRIISMRRFQQGIKHRTLRKNRHNEKKDAPHLEPWYEKYCFKYCMTFLATLSYTLMLLV